MTILHRTMRFATWILAAVLYVVGSQNQVLASRFDQSSELENVERRLIQLREERARIYTEDRQRGGLIRQQREDIERLLVDYRRRLRQMQQNGPDRSGWKDVPVYGVDPKSRKKVKSGTQVQLYSTSKDKKRYDEIYDRLVRRIWQAEDLLTFYADEIQSISQTKRESLERLGKELRQHIQYRTALIEMRKGKDSN